MKIKFCFFATLFTLALSACTDDDATRRTLVSSGYTEIVVTGYEMFGCGKDDTYVTGFRAKNPNGVQVTGVVCCGVMKSCTVRF